MSYGQFSDSAMAVGVSAAVLTDRFVHVHGVGWLEYDGILWREVPADAVIEAVRAWTAGRLIDAIREHEPEPVIKGWVQWQNVSRVKAAVEFCRGILALDGAKLDANPDLLNCPNGVVDLRTGEIKPHMPWYYFTKVTGSEYDPKAKHADWEMALSALPEEILTWYQIRCGQGITGHMTDDTCLVQVGGGANGKSTVAAGIAAALGGYHHAATERLLMPAGRDAMTPEMADLRGARFVAIEETPETGRLDTQRLKSVVGTPTITARKLYRDYFTFQVTHSIFLNTNFTPIVTESDHGTWRRLLLVLFPYTFCASPIEEWERPGDTGLRARLRDWEQGKAVLAWLVDGAVCWHAAGYGPTPDKVSRDTAEWRAGADHVESFWDEFLIPDPDRFITVADMMRAFTEYLSALGGARMAEGTFSRRFLIHPRTREAGVTKGTARPGGEGLTLSRPNLDHWRALPPVSDGTVKAWKGVRFRPSGDDSQSPL